MTVFAHFLYQFQDDFYLIDSSVDFIYMFHMPAFVFISGYFGKSRRSRSLTAIFRLIFLYYIFNSIMGFLFGFQSLLEPKNSYWYLIALIVWRLTAYHLEKFSEINLILFAVAIFAGFFSTIDNTFAAARIIAFYPYYMFGYKLKCEQSEAFLQERYSRRFFKGIVVLTIAGVTAFWAYHSFAYSDRDLQMYGYSAPLGAFGRVVLYLIAFSAIYVLRSLCPEKRLPLLTMFGRNSLWIFLFHRPFTLWSSGLLAGQGEGVIICLSLLGTLAICLIFGNDLIAEHMDRFADSGAAIFTGKQIKKFTMAKLTGTLVALGFVVLVVADAYSGLTLDDLKKILHGEFEGGYEYEQQGETDIIYPVMSAAQKSEFDNAFRITFSGDLILLEDQVKRAYTDDGYDFSPVFEYARDYIVSADYAIGVFEGPMAGEDAGYTSSNYDDDKALFLNFPDQFAEAVKDTGFDLVTTANNHVLDRGVEGVVRTLDIMDRIGLDHIGSYRSESEKENKRIKYVECEGIKMAILSYTYGSNYYGSQLTDGALSYITSVISGTSGEQFEKMRAEVERDFEDAKRLDPDLIIVLPHMGTQFSNRPDEEQTVWFDIFKECGADIILGDHPHVVEPALIEDYNGRKIFTAYCPGNFANIYRENQGDTSMLIDVYIDRDTRRIIGGGIVPMYTQAPVDGNYRALPIYEIVNNTELRKQLSTDDYARAQAANNIITKVVFGNKMDISSVTERYYFDETGFIRMKADGLTLTDEMKDGVLYGAIEKADSICFIGDSLTEGTKNGGCPWYEPIEKYMNGKEICNYSKGGCTVSYIAQNTADIANADLYVIAVGTNDVRYRDEKLCAMTAGDYINAIEDLRAKLSQKNPLAEFVFIAPWYSVDGDPFCSLPFDRKTELNNEYSEALRKYCDKQDIGFIDPNPYIRDMLNKNPDSVFLLDHIHPNSGRGVVMYSEAALLY